MTRPTPEPPSIKIPGSGVFVTFAKNISVAVSHLNGCSIDKTKNIESDRVYYFIKADAEFKINNEIVNVKDGDVLYIEKNTSYSMEGHFDAVLINTPAFDIKNEIKE